MKNYTVLYKCHRCGDVSRVLRLTCDHCGTRLRYKEQESGKNGV
jgi:DNA-directed RNA polymerase subunit RPC12/RpoP